MSSAGDAARAAGQAQLATPNRAHNRVPAGPTRGRTDRVYIYSATYILQVMGKHLIDLDEEILSAARTELGTDTIKATVNTALRAACAARGERVAAALDALASFEFDDRERAWR